MLIVTKLRGGVRKVLIFFEISVKINSVYYVQQIGGLFMKNVLKIVLRIIASRGCEIHQGHAAAA